VKVRVSNRIGDPSSSYPESMGILCQDDGSWCISLRVITSPGE